MARERFPKFSLTDDYPVFLRAIQINGKPATTGGTGGDHWEIPLPWGYHSLNSPGVKSDNPRGGIFKKFRAQGCLITKKVHHEFKPPMGNCPKLIVSEQ